jgi:hypothetical protein
MDYLCQKERGRGKMELKNGNDGLGWFTDSTESKLCLTNCKQTGFMRFEVLATVLMKLKSFVVLLHIDLQIAAEFQK